MLRHLILAAAIAVLPASLAHAQITDITSGRPNGLTTILGERSRRLTGLRGRRRPPGATPRSRRSTTTRSNPKSPTRSRRTIRGRPSVRRRPRRPQTAIGRNNRSAQANRSRKRTDRCFAWFFSPCSPSRCLRRRSNIRRARSACWSASPRAAARPPGAHHLAAARHRSQAVVLHREPARRERHHRGARGRDSAAPDGLTLLFSSSSIAPTPHIYKNLGYDTLADLRPVATSGILDGLLVLVEAKSPIKSVAGSDRRGEIRPRAVRLARRRQRAASRAPRCSRRRPASPCSTCPTRARRRSSPRCSAAACR